MSKNIVKLGAVALVFCFIILSCFSCSYIKKTAVTQIEETSIMDLFNGSSNKFFKSWKDNSSVKQILVNYVSDVTNDESANFIPINDRIATFDLDGTLITENQPSYFDCTMLVYRVLEDPTCNASQELKNQANNIKQAFYSNSFNAETEKIQDELFKKAFSGMTIAEYKKFVSDFKNTDAEGFNNLKRSDIFFKPMVEIIEYLQANSFTVYIVSGAERDAVRVLIDGVLDIPNYQVIGTDFSYKSLNQGDLEGRNYNYEKSDKVIKGDELLNKDVKANKVFSICREIGQKPVLAFGNSSGDYSMYEYTVTDNQYKSAVFTLANDDSQREYGSDKKCADMIDRAKKSGWNIISMKNDFETVFGNGVTKSEKSSYSIDNSSELSSVA